MYSRVIEQVLTCRRYDTLPNRVILSSPFHQKRHQSFGIMLYCTSTDEWLLVRSKFSYAFNLIMSGMYRKSDLPFIVTQLTCHEKDTIKDLISGTKNWTDVYVGYNIAMTQERFQQIKHTLRQMLMSTHTKNSVDWTFPKGRMESKETPWECAHREFNEEAGFNILSVDAYLVDDKPFYEHYTSFDHDVYETTCWFYTIKNKIEVVSPVGDEIEERIWVTTQQAHTMLSISKSAMIQKALELLCTKNTNEEATRSQIMVELPNEERNAMTPSGEQTSL